MQNALDAEDHSSWTKAVHSGKRIQQNCVGHEKLQKNFHKGLDFNFPENAGTEFDFVSNECNCICLSMTGLKILSKKQLIESSPNY